MNEVDPTKAINEVIGDVIAPVAKDPLLTEEQEKKMAAIQMAIAVLNDAKVAFIVFASPDDIAPGMRITHGQRLSYDPDEHKALAQMIVSKQNLMGAALKTLSVGFRGVIATTDERGNPALLFENGRVSSVMKRDKAKEVVV